MKKRFFTLLSLLFLLGLSLVATNTATATVSFDFLADRTVTDFFQSVMEHLQGVIAFLAVLFIVIAGILYVTSGGNSSMTTAAKTCLVGAIIGFALALAGPSFLQQINVAVYGSKDPTVPTNLSAAPTVAMIVTGVLEFLLSVLGMLAIIGLTVSGILYLAAAGNASQAERAKQAMKYSIIGIAVAGASLLIIRQIDVLI